MPPPPDEQYQLEGEIQAKILIRFGARTWLKIWRQNTGKGYGVDRVMQARKLLERGALAPALEMLNQTRPIKFGEPGTADILGVLNLPDVAVGRFVAIECKVWPKKPDEDQRNWRDMILRLGGVYVLAYQLRDVYCGLHAAGVPESRLWERGRG